MCKLLVGVNTAMFDGLEADVAFRTIREAGFNYVELAYNQGYVGDLSPELFSDNNAQHILELLEKYQLKSHTLGATMNLGSEDAIAQFTQRIKFASKIGVTWLTVCVGRKEDRAKIVSNLQALASVAKEHKCVICLENGGDPNYDVFRLADDGFALLKEIDSSAVAFNVDAGNIVSLCPDADAIKEAIAMLPGAKHCHIKDVLKVDGEYTFPVFGQGQLDYPPLLQALEQHAIPCSFEIPLRMHRQRDTYPVRGPAPIDPATSLEVLIHSRTALEKMLGYSL